MHPMLNIAIQAARQASNFIAKSYENPDSIAIIKKSRNYFLTNIDIKAAQIIIEVIKKFYPTHTIITEKNGKILGKKDNIQWIIVPLDGTLNFTKSLPHFSVSIAVCINNRTEIAIVYNPMLNELFTAVRGQGAQLNGYRLRIKNTNKLEGAIIAIGFHFQKVQYLTPYINIITKLFKKSADFRRTGSLSLDLAYVAAGRIDAFFEIGLKSLSFLAGELLIREAGGLVTDFVGGLNYINTGNLIIGNPYIVKIMLQEIHNEFNNN